MFAWKLGLDWSLPAFLVLTAALVALSAIDLETYRPPTPIIYVAGGAGGALGAFARYRDIILDWSNGRRPVVHARDEFRLAQIEAAWRRLLANPEFRSP